MFSPITSRKVDPSFCINANKYEEDAYQHYLFNKNTLSSSAEAGGASKRLWGCEVAAAAISEAVGTSQVPTSELSEGLSGYWKSSQDFIWTVAHETGARCTWKVGWENGPRITRSLLQWGFEIGRNFKWDLKPEAQPFEIRTNGCHSVKNHLKSGRKCPANGWEAVLSA